MCDRPLPATCKDIYWRSPHSRPMRSRVFVTVRSPSLCLSHSHAAAACVGFAAVGPASRGYRSISARSAARQSGAAAPRASANAGSATLAADVKKLKRLVSA